MNRKLISALMSFWFATAAVGRAQTLDKEMSALAEKIGKALAAKGCKNVAAVDFTDLQGQPTELGRFLAEQLTVEIVATSSVSMVDRANIKSILAEHKLTEEGLVNPANAKKLGEFAGVDAILIGNATALDDGIVLMVKAISTASAQIVAAGRIKFPKTSEIQQLLNRSVSGGPAASSPAAVSAGERSGSSYQEAGTIATKDSGSLRVVLKSVAPIRSTDGRSVNAIRCSFDFINRETQRPVVVAMNAGAPTVQSDMADYLRSSFVDDRGVVWRVSKLGVGGIGVVGVGMRTFNGSSYNPGEIADLLAKQDEINSNVRKDGFGNNYSFVFGAMTTILPGQSARVTATFARTNQPEPVSTPKFFGATLEIVVGVVSAGTQKSYSILNLAFDRVSVPSI